MKIQLGVLNTKAGRETIVKLTNGNKSLHQDGNDNGVIIIILVTSKYLILKSTMFPHRNIRKHNWTSPDGRSHN